jgi:microcin C transport system permease protein
MSDRLRRFRRLRRAWMSLWILAAAFALSLASELISNDRPLLVVHEGSAYVPVVAFHPGSRFGLPYDTPADYHALERDSAFRAGGGLIVFPPVKWGPYRADLDREGNPPHPPSREHWLGTDASGRDVFSRLLYGFRLCMAFALLITALAAVVSLFSWIGLSYYMRGEFFRLRDLNYVKSARALGVPASRIFLRHVLPNALTPVVTMLPFLLVSGISALTSLDFLGFGLQPPAPSWGELLRQGLENLHAPWLAVTSTAALFVTLMLATFVGEGLREAFDPKADARVE